MVDKNDALFRELEDEMRRERFAKIWERYGIYFILAAVAIVLMVGGNQFWKSHTQAQADAAGAEYDAATKLAESGKFEDAAKAFGSIAETSPKGYATLASLSEAGAYLKLDKRAEAFAIFDRIAEDRSADPLLSNFARLQAASLRLGEADFTEMENRLKPLLADTSAWRFTAREFLAITAIKAGKIDEARTLLAPSLADPALPRTTAERINRLMAGIATAELASTPAPAPKAEEPKAEAEKKAGAEPTATPAP